MLSIGLENFLQDSAKYAGSSTVRFGCLSNHACTDRNLTQSRILLREKLGGQLTCLFSPQHGFFAEKQDNMIESAHCSDEVTGLPLFSLYGEHRKPTREMFACLDVLLIDLIDVGTRVYTFMYTMANCMMAAAECGKKVIILDRPNPIGGAVEGNILRPDCASFVGLYAIPMRHGMTLGELALMMNDAFGIGCDLEVVPVCGWQRDVLARESGFPWIAPSPNMPTPETALVYPGQVIWEGTLDSEGRGTTMPFEFVGAPYWRHEPILEKLRETDLPGCIFRSIAFEPTSGKHAGENCIGFQIHVTDACAFRPWRSSLALLQAVMLLYPESFAWKQPPYEYEFKRLPMDLILGDRQLRQRLEEGVPVMELEAGWRGDLDKFMALREQYLLYK